VRELIWSPADVLVFSNVSPKAVLVSGQQKKPCPAKMTGPDPKAKKNFNFLGIEATP